MTKWTTRKWLIVACVCFIVIALGGGVGYWLLKSNNQLVSESEFISKWKEHEEYYDGKPVLITGEIEGVANLGNYTLVVLKGYSVAYFTNTQNDFPKTGTITFSGICGRDESMRKLEELGKESAR